MPELMAVVVITGLLGAICTSLVIRHMAVAKNTEGLGDLKTIGAAVEAFNVENGSYLDCSRKSGPQWFPTGATPNHVRYPWVAPGHLDWDQWRLLALPKTGITRFGFVLNAGLPGGTLPKFYVAKPPPVVVPHVPWYVVQVRGDKDDDGKFMNAYMTSFTGEVVVENEAE